MAADPRTMSTLGGVQPQSVAWRAFVQMAGLWSLYGFGMFSVIERATNRWIGRVGPWRPHGWPGSEIGWSEFIHCIDPVNHRSIALAERIGSKRLREADLPAPVL
jgi:hypothetical protein